MMRDKEELARIKQRQFYLDMAERFTQMADEYSPANYAENPLPINGFTAVITVHASSHDELEREVRAVAGSWHYHYANYGDAESSDSVNGRGSVRFEHIYPEQTEDGYLHDLNVWSETRKAKRAAEREAEK